jgi:hypothetical protein
LEKVHNLEGQKLEFEEQIHKLNELVTGEQDKSDQQQRRKDVLEKELKVYIYAATLNISKLL